MTDFSREFTDIVPARILSLLPDPNSGVKVRDSLRRCFTPRQVAGESDQRRAWELCGIYYLRAGRPWDAIGPYEALYRHLIAYQNDKKKRAHKGVPPLWLHDCHAQLGNPVLAKRYLMLTLAEDAITGKGTINPQSTGSYNRCLGTGMSEQTFFDYGRLFWRLAQKARREACFPEWLLQEVGQEWITEQPSSRESVIYSVNGFYVRFLLNQLGTTGGKALERLAHYLLSCIPGCRATTRLRSKSTDYDVLGAVEGAFADFRSEVGRYFLCECKDWSKPADFSALAKFSRVLDSTKTTFGVLFSKNGITGSARTTDADRELLKVFQHRGIVIIVITAADLKHVAKGANFIAMLRQKYEQVRFDLSLGSAKQTR